METLRSFRLLAVRLSLLLTAVAAGIAAIFGWPAVQGVLMGGIAGTLAFWLTARQVEKLATGGKSKVYSVPLGWRFLEMLIYILVLARAYTLDREALSGFLGAVAGLFIIRAVIVLLGVTGLDLKDQGPE